MDLDKLIKAKKEKGFTFEELAKRSDISISALKDIFRGKTPAPRIDTMQAIEKALGITDTPRAKKIEPVNCEVYNDDLVNFSIIGCVRAGYDGLAIEEETGDIQPIPRSMLRGRPESDFFILRVVGNSMHPKLIDGDNVLVERCDSVESGKVAVILYGGDCATVKIVRYKEHEDWLELVPINPEYEVKRIEGPDLEQCRVLGKVIKLLRDMD